MGVLKCMYYVACIVRGRIARRSSMNLSAADGYAPGSPNDWMSGIWVGKPHADHFHGSLKIYVAIEPYDVQKES